MFEREARAKEAKEKAAKDDAPKDANGRPKIFGQLYNSSRHGYLQGRHAVLSFSKNATGVVADAVPAALSKAKVAAKGAAGWMLDAVKSGFDSHPYIGIK